MLCERASSKRRESTGRAHLVALDVFCALQRGARGPYGVIPEKRERDLITRVKPREKAVEMRSHHQYLLLLRSGSVFGASRSFFLWRWSGCGGGWLADRSPSRTNRHFCSFPT